MALSPVACVETSCDGREDARADAHSIVRNNALTIRGTYELTAEVATIPTPPDFAITPAPISLHLQLAPCDSRLCARIHAPASSYAPSYTE
jgi:hypothetical protein